MLFFCENVYKIKGDITNGKLSEWSNDADSKSVEQAIVPGVQIPHFPPNKLYKKSYFIQHKKEIGNKLISFFL